MIHASQAKQNAETFTPDEIINRDIDKSIQEIGELIEHVSKKGEKHFKMVLPAMGTNKEIFEKHSDRIASEIVKEIKNFGYDVELIGKTLIIQW